MTSSSTTIDWLSRLKELNTDKPDHKKEFRDILTNSFIHWDLVELYQYYRECEKDSNFPDWVLGGLGFLLFSVAVEIQVDINVEMEKDKKNPETEKQLLAANIRDNIFENNVIYKFIVNEYSIDEIKGLEPKYSIKFHRCGTTSYILKLKFPSKFNNEFVALKILKYKYINNQTINNETKNYQSIYQDDKYMPKIHDSGCAFIIMDFIRGDTLNEVISKEIRDQSSKKLKDKLICAIILDLCKILAHFANEKKINHNDLNANNIIIQNLELQNDEYTFNMYLIDFGVNYLINENIGSSQALDKVGVFIPAEVLMDLGNASIMSDIYSIGVILLKMLTNKDDFENTRFDDYIDAIRLDYPVLSSLLDDILDKNPDMRLFDSQIIIKKNMDMTMTIFLKN